MVGDFFRKGTPYLYHNILDTSLNVGRVLWREKALTGGVGVRQTPCRRRYDSFCVDMALALGSAALEQIHEDSGPSLDFVVFRIAGG